MLRSHCFLVEVEMNTGFRGVTPFASGYPLSARSGRPAMPEYADPSAVRLE